MYNKLIEKYDSPLYLYNIDKITDAYTHLEYILPIDSKILFSVKCNNNNTVIKHLAVLGSYFEISNVEEYNILMENGVDYEAVLFTSPAKKFNELYCVIKNGIGMISCESIEEFALINSICLLLDCSVNVVIRINIPSRDSTSSLKMGGKTSQFGIDLDIFLDNIASFSSNFVQLCGIHTFYGSNIKNLKDIVYNVNKVVEVSNYLEKMGMDIRIIDFGGGFPATFSENQNRFNLKYLKGKLEQEFKKINVRNKKKLYFESGRYLLADSGILLGTVLYEKVSYGINYLITDIGVHCLNGLSSSRKILPSKNEINFIDNRTGEHKYIMVGPSCSPLDIVNPNVYTQKKVKSGDIFYINNVGAYGLSASLVNFLSRKLPNEICFSDDNIISVTRTSVLKKEID